MKKYIVVTLTLMAFVLTGCFELLPLEVEESVESELGEVEESLPSTEGEVEEAGCGPYSTQDEVLAEIEQEVYLLINQERVANGLPELFMDECVREASRRHCWDMVENDFFAHASANGDSPGERLDNLNIPWMQYGENLAYNYAYSDPATIAVEGWMDSPGHRANILSSRVTHTGVGVAQDSKGAFYLTQDFVAY